MTDIQALIREIIELDHVPRMASGLRLDWRWILSPAAVMLLRQYAGMPAQASVNVDLDGELTVFGIPAEVDEHASRLVELRLSKPNAEVTKSDPMLKWPPSVRT